MNKILLVTTFILISITSIPQENTSPIHVDSLETKKEISEVPFSIIEDVPIYKGCPKTDTANLKRKCMSSKISEFIFKNFKIELLDHPNIKVGKIKIIATFKIDTLGYTTQVRAKSKYPELEKEAIRVIKEIPRFDSPGEFKGKPVSVPFSLPILLQKEK